MRITKYRTELIKEQSNNYNINPIDIKTNTPDSVGKVLKDLYNLDNQAEEVMYLVCLNTKNRIVGVHEVSRGSLNCSVTHPREIFKRACLNNADKIIIAHNHPSGCVEPSKEDKGLYHRLVECGELMGIKLADFIIIGSSILNRENIYNDEKHHSDSMYYDCIYSMRRDMI